MFTLTGSSSRDSILFSPSAVWLAGDTGEPGGGGGRVRVLFIDSADSSYLGGYPENVKSSGRKYNLFSSN